ncbi:unnamed protein product [Gongylonema pulchrum]|uniref:Ras-associating domain-containing protein n=1 Tax=Gongylonema pulchrum TaxID=637853 RepID=A0A183E7F8_9BILA|nr:unnamed protein product [Gongylonema pulchrum]
MAERCLSTVMSEEDPALCGGGTLNRIMCDNTSDLCSSPSRGSGESSRSSNRHKSSRTDFPNIKEGDYAVPPDASQDVRATLISSAEPKNHAKSEEPLIRIAVSDIRSVTKLVNKMGYGLQITTANGQHCYAAETVRATDEWIAVLTHSLRDATISEVSQRATCLNTEVSGHVIKAKCGNAKRLFASVVEDKLLFFRSSDDRVPCSHICLKGAHIYDKLKNAVDESGGSSDEQGENNCSQEFEHTVSVEIANTDPVYIVLRSAEEKDKWIYFLKKAAGDATALAGTPFEVLVQRMMTENTADEDPLWNDALLTTCEEKPKETLMTVSDESLRRKTLELGRACFMFTSVLMRPAGVQYHIDLAQNILSTAMLSDLLKNELYAYLVKLTSGSMPYGIQAWKLMALAAPLFAPRHYSLLWLVRRHIEKWSAKRCDEGKFAMYCSRALNRCLKVGGRTEGPSKLETISILVRDPTLTNMPHSIPVLLPTNEYHVIDFDGSTDIGACLSTLCVKCGLRPALLSGYALYVEDPVQPDRYLLLKNKQKLCDCISRWERELMDSKCGRVTEDVARIKLALRHRQYWSHLVLSETSAERTFLVHRMANEIVAGRIPVSSELGEELAAVFAQMKFGDLKTMTDEQFREIITSYYPAKLLDVGCERPIRLNVETNWSELRGVSAADCTRMILLVLRKWRFFGSFIMEARMKMRNDESLFIALNDQGVHLLTFRQLVSIYASCTVTAMQNAFFRDCTRVYVCSDFCLGFSALKPKKLGS